jgi:hypothetical protein
VAVEARGSSVKNPIRGPELCEVRGSIAGVLPWMSCTEPGVPEDDACLLVGGS